MLIILDFSYTISNFNDSKTTAPNDDYVTLKITEKLTE